jgi:hypothetical protein
MKSFIQYLTESKTDYRFRIYHAGKPDASFSKLIKVALASYGVKDIADAKSRPVEHNHPMFPNMSNPEVYTIDVTCEYPVTAEIMRKSVTDYLPYKAAVTVSNLEHEEDLAMEQEAIAANTSKEPLLMRDYEKIKVAHPYGADFNSKLVKNSITGTGQVKVKGGAKPAETTNDLKTGSKSPVGSTKITKPTIDDIKKRNK